MPNSEDTHRGVALVNTEEDEVWLHRKGADRHTRLGRLAGYHVSMWERIEGFDSRQDSLDHRRRVPRRVFRDVIEDLFQVGRDALADEDAVWSGHRQGLQNFFRMSAANWLNSTNSPRSI
jgi:hypothetical protein